MGYRIAESLDELRDEINTAYPNRGKTSDGWIGDAAHQNEGSSSDHNPWVIDADGTGVVTALDITTRGGSDPGDELAERLRMDPRTKYVIRNQRIANGGQPWTPYYGADHHDTHTHVSVLPYPSAYDNRTPWLSGEQGAGGGQPIDVQEDDMTPEQVQTLVDIRQEQMRQGGVLAGLAALLTPDLRQTIVDTRSEQERQAVEIDVLAVLVDGPLRQTIIDTRAAQATSGGGSDPAATAAEIGRRLANG
jgi:hypothetical protein